MKNLIKILPPLAFLFLSISFSYAADSLPQCLNQASSSLENEENSKTIFNTYKRCIWNFKKQATYSQCADTMKKLKHKDMLYICSEVKQDGSLDECLKQSVEVYDKSENRLAGFAFKNCVDNFKNEGTYKGCVENIMASKHRDNITVCNVVKKDGTFKYCLEENIKAFEGVNEQRRVRLAYQGCADAFKKTSTQEECSGILRANSQNHFNDLCRTFPKEERYTESDIGTDGQGVN